MNITKTIPRDYAEKNLKEILLSMEDEDNQMQELVFPPHMIENYFAQSHHSCYEFAHNLEGQPYMRARMDGITLEYLVRTNPEKPGYEEARICSIYAFGKTIYRRPDNPIGIIYVF